ncbi:MAG TPA: pyridoxal phosphate-dependent aminotransferase [Stellaceae bacterium]|nr:pyridoxal phosphate-dependent aminotransferase [Stellaceae bacterium]
MDLLAKRLGSINFSQTLAIGQRAARMRAAGHDIISLGLGEPDFKIAENIRSATAKAALEGHERSGPVEGISELKSAVVRKLNRENGLSYEPEQIVIGAGSKQIIFNAMMATLDPGDEVIIPAPYWVSYPDIVRMAGANPVTVPCTSQLGHKITADMLNSAITAKTKWFILNSPSNPTGAVYRADELHALAEVLRARPGILILSDEIYEKFVYPPAKFASIAGVAPDLRDRILTVNGPSKTYSMIGWRIGYGAGPVELIRGMMRIQSQVTSSTCTIAQIGTAAALLGPQESVAATIADYHERRNLVVELASRIRFFHAIPPDGAFYLFPDCSALIGASTRDGKVFKTDVDVVDYLIDVAGVVTVPGSAFGMGPALRMAYTCPRDRLEVAFDRIATALDGVRH